MSQLGDLAEPQLLLEGGRSLATWARRARSGLGREGSLSLARAAPFPAAVMLQPFLVQLGFLGLLPRQTSEGPASVSGPRRAAGGGRPRSFHLPSISVQGTFAFAGSLVLGRIWKLNSLHAGKRCHIFPWLWVRKEKGDADVM